MLEKRFKCRICGLVFAIAGTVTEYDENAIPCPGCGETGPLKTEEAPEAVFINRNRVENSDSCPENCENCKKSCKIET